MAPLIEKIQLPYGVTILSYRNHSRYVLICVVTICQYAHVLPQTVVANRVFCETDVETAYEDYSIKRRKTY